MKRTNKVRRFSVLRAAGFKKIRSNVNDLRPRSRPETVSAWGGSVCTQATKVLLYIDIRAIMIIITHRIHSKRTRRYMLFGSGILVKEIMNFTQSA